MVDQAFLDRLKTVCDSLEHSRGELNLFAIFKMDELTEKWIVVVSAPWVAGVSFEEAFSGLRILLIENLGDDMSTIARIGIFGLDDHFIELVMEKYATGDSIKEDQQINGNLVHEGHIIKLVKPD